MDDAWMWRMFGCVCAGSFFGLLWPLIIALYRNQTDHFYRLISPEKKEIRFGGKAPSAAWTFLTTYVFPLFWLLLISAGIAGVIAALGFVGVLDDETKRENLKKLGALAYFSAFGSGFGLASFVEEPLKNTK
jgi:hypothetical protein